VNDYDPMSSDYDVMLDAARKLFDAAAPLGAHQELRTAASLDEAIPPPPSYDPLDPDLLSHAFADLQQKIAAPIRGPYATALKDLDEFMKSTQQKIQNMAAAVKASAEAYRAADENSERRLHRIEGDFAEH
jgi:hypothetical protein